MARKVLSPVELQILALVVEERTGREVAALFEREAGRRIPFGSLYTSFRRMRVRGLMTIGAHVADEAIVRASFARLRNLQEDVARSARTAVQMDYLSMGMSGDFEWAVEEGANLLRLGTAIFGARAG